MGVDPKWGCFPICPEMSRFVPICPLFVLLGARSEDNRDKRGPTGTERDISGQMGKRPHLGSTRLALLTKHEQLLRYQRWKDHAIWKVSLLGL